MASITIPVDNEIYNTDRLLYTSARQYGRRSKFTDWSNIEPFVMKYPSPFEAPLITNFKSEDWFPNNDITPYVDNYAQTHPRQFELELTPPVSTEGVTHDGIELEIYHDIYKSQFPALTKYVPTTSERPYTFTMSLSDIGNAIPHEVNKDNINMWHRSYFRARYKNDDGVVSPWSNFVKLLVTFIRHDGINVLNHDQDNIDYFDRPREGYPDGSDKWVPVKIQFPELSTSLPSMLPYEDSVPTAVIMNTYRRPGKNLPHNYDAAPHKQEVITDFELDLPTRTLTFTCPQSLCAESTLDTYAPIMTRFRLAYKCGFVTNMSVPYRLYGPGGNIVLDIPIIYG